MSDVAPLVRKFVLHSDAEAMQLYAFLKQRAELARRGKVFQVVVAEYAPMRRREQNAKMWVGILEPTAQQVRNPRLTAKGWHFVLKQMFLPETCAKGVDKWRYTEKDEPELAMSTGDLNEQEMELYLHEIAAYVSTDLGVRLPANPRDL